MSDRYERSYRFIVWIRRQGPGTDNEPPRWIGAIHKVPEVSEEAISRPPKKVFFNDLDQIPAALKEFIASRTGSG